MNTGLVRQTSESVNAGGGDAMLCLLARRITKLRTILVNNRSELARQLSPPGFELIQLTSLAR